MSDDAHAQSKGGIALISRISAPDCPLLKDVAALDKFLDAGNSLLLINAAPQELGTVPERAQIVSPTGDSIVANINAAYERIEADACSYVGYIDENANFDNRLFDEMIEVLESADRNAICSPRARRLPFFSLPCNDVDSMLDPVYAPKALEAAKTLLPCYSIAPYAHAACFLIEKDIVDNFCFLDEEIEDLDVAVIDLSSRVNRYGYSTVLANHVFLMGSYPGNSAVDLRAHPLLMMRYPYIACLEAEYETMLMSRADRFFSLLTKDREEKTKLLFEFSIMPPSYCGTSNYQLSLLKCFCRLFSDSYEIYVRVGEKARAFHKLDERFPNVAISDTFDCLFDIGFAANQPTYPDQMDFMESHCLKMVYSMLDIEMSRCDYMRVAHTRIHTDYAVRLGMAVSDGIITISDYAQQDCLAYYHACAEAARADLRSILINTDNAADSIENEEFRNRIPFDKYFLIPGNATFAHKALREAVSAVADSSESFAVIGLSHETCSADNVIGFPGGFLSDEFVDYLYGHCEALLFPSVYEGYGLPVAMALKKGKCVIVHDNPMNRELQKAYPEVAEQFYFFKTFQELPDAVQRVALDLKNGKKGQYLAHTWEDSAKQTRAYLDEILLRPADPRHLEQRRFLINLVTGLEKYEEKRCDTSLFVDCGRDFQEEHSIHQQSFISSSHTVQSLFDISTFSTIKGIRLDPDENSRPMFCRIISAKLDGQDLTLKGSNAFVSQDGFELFTTSDPQYYFDAPTSGNNLEIVYQIIRLDSSSLNTALEDFKQEQERIECTQEQEIRRLENEIKALKESTSWKITSPIRKIKNMVG